MSAIVQHKRCDSGIQSLVMCLVAAAMWITISAVPAQAQTYTYTTLYSFQYPPDGEYPAAGLVRDSRGNLYGTTFEGGALNGGTVFELSTVGKETILSNFSETTDTGRPAASLVLDNAGNLYGTTPAGGTSGQGTVYKLDRAGTLTVLHSFTGGAEDGGTPMGALVRDKLGNLYGTTFYGGNGTCSEGCGTVFRLSASGEEKVLHTFTGANGDGSAPMAGLIREAAGNLYGTTWSGGDLSCNNGVGCGIVFEISSSGTETVLHTFTGGTGGQNSPAALVRDASGNLYGTTAWGGDLNCEGTVLAPGCGTVFKLTKEHKFTVLHRFLGGADGSYPTYGLVLDSAGNLYGTTVLGGNPSCDCGTVFEINAGGEKVLYTPNAFISGTLVRDAAGNFYGATYGAGVNNLGSLFELTP